MQISFWFLGSSFPFRRILILALSRRSAEAHRARNWFKIKAWRGNRLKITTNERARCKSKFVVEEGTKEDPNPKSKLKWSSPLNLEICRTRERLSCPCCTWYPFYDDTRGGFYLSASKHAPGAISIIRLPGVPSSQSMNESATYKKDLRTTV